MTDMVNKVLAVDIKKVVEDGAQDLMMGSIDDYDKAVELNAAYIMGAKKVADSLGVRLNWKTGIMPFGTTYVNLYIDFYGEKNASA